MSKYSKVMLTVRIIVTVVGFSLGSLIMWSVSDHYDLIPSGAIKYLFYVVAGIVLGSALLLSTPAMVSFFRSLGEMLTRAASSVSAMTTALCYTLTAVVAVLASFGIEYLLSLFFDIIWLRIFIVVILAVVILIGGISICAAVTAKVKRNVNKSYAIKPADKGYLLSGEALNFNRILEVCNSWLVGKIFVLKTTVDGFYDLGNIDALRNYKQLSESGRIKTVNPKAYAIEDSYERAYAVKARLKLITLTESGFENELALSSLGLVEGNNGNHDEKTVD